MADELDAAWRKSAPGVPAGPPRRVGRGAWVRPVLAGLALAAVAATIYGLATDADGFFGNWIAELVGISAGVFLAVVLIERALKRIHQIEWDSVRERLVRETTDRVLTIATHFALRVGGQQAMRYPGLVGTDRHELRDEVADGIDELTVVVRDAAPRFSRELIFDRASSRSLFDDAMSAHRPVGDVISRLLVLNEAPGLVAALMRLEDGLAAWAAEVREVERTLAPAGHAWDLAVDALRATSDVYRELLTVRG